MYKKELELSKQLAVIAGEKIMEVYQTDFEVELKSDESPITLADKGANDIIIKGLKKAFPEYGILSEEDQSDMSRFERDLVFVIDPLDGTKEFVKKNGEFTVNIGLIDHKKSVMGVIYVPVTKELYFASYQEGAFYTKDGKTTKIHVSDKLEDLIMVGSKSHPDKREEDILNRQDNNVTTRISRGSSLKGCQIAHGLADVYYRFTYTNEWDVCAMHAIISEAGGIFKQMDHTDMTYNRIDHVNRKGFYVLNRKENLFI